ncbi:hypothetical protein LTR04_004447, partial [Oleoguttula sp. CCFEE 6159]
MIYDCVLREDGQIVISPTTSAYKQPPLSMVSKLLRTECLPWYYGINTFRASGSPFLEYACAHINRSRDKIPFFIWWLRRTVRTNCVHIPRLLLEIDGNNLTYHWATVRLFKEIFYHNNEAAPVLNPSQIDYVFSTKILIDQ